MKLSVTQALALLEIADSGKDGISMHGGEVLTGRSLWRRGLVTYAGLSPKGFGSVFQITDAGRQEAERIRSSGQSGPQP